MTIPGWSTIGLFLTLVVQFVLSWDHAKKTGKSFREAVLPGALIAGGCSIPFAREFFGNLPVWIDAPLVILYSLIILFALGLLLVRLNRYLKDAWRLEDKKDK
jgi:hypothetical protein